MITDKDLKDAPILVMANKQDRPEALKPDELYEKLEIRALEKKNIVF